MSTDPGHSMAESAQVLIIDDNQDAAMSLTLLLELENISSVIAPDAETALQMIERISPSLFLIDVGLPGMNGFELAKRLRETARTSKATLIALTGREVRASDEPAKALFDQFWHKPFEPNRLLLEVKRLLQAK
jgi:DNA-binding response OmpR family regulator